MRRVATVVAASISVVMMLTLLAGPASAQEYPPEGQTGEVPGDEITGDVAGPTAQQPDGTDVDGSAQTNDPDLAFTGTEINVPVAVGAILIGFGGLLSLAANKRRRQLI